jgi:putative FmdB family regulatory protein
MPIYEYQCSSCGFIKEVMHKISETPEVICPKCSNKMKKLMSPSAFHLKGSGWYVTDYANKNNSSKNRKKSTSNTNNSSACNTCSAKAANE